MWYLIAQTAVFILIAGAIGLWLGGYLGRLSRQLEIDVLDRRVANGLEDLAEARAQHAAAERRLVEQGAATATANDRLRALEAELAQAREAAAEPATAAAEPDPALQQELAELRERNRQQARELAASQEQYRALAAELDELRGAAAAPDAPRQADAGDAPPAAVSAALARAAAAMGSGKPAPKSAGRFAADASGAADDLQKIKGIGPRLSGLLNELGVYRYRQIAQFTPDDVAWVNERLRFKGRIEREKWIEQARNLADT